MVGAKKTNLRAGFFYILIFFRLRQFLCKEFKGNLWVGLAGLLFSELVRSILIGVEAIEKVDLLIWMIIKLYYNL